MEEIKPTLKQELFIQSDVDELFYGGARGGGKSFACLLDFASRAAEYGKHAQGLFFRRSYKELEEVIKISKELYSSFATWRVGDKQWNFRNGAVLKLRYLESDEDTMKYQGFSLCLGSEKEIQTTKGPKRIKDIVVGDSVITLEGPKRVLAVKEPYDTECVSLEDQIHPIDHPVLTAWGWQSYSSLLESYSKGSVEKSLRSDKPLSLNVPLRLVKRISYQDESSGQTSIQFRNNGKPYGFSQGSKEDLSFSPLGLRLLFEWTGSLLAKMIAFCGNVHALRKMGKALNLKAHYWYGRRRYGGPLLGLPRNGLTSPPSQADAVEHNHSFSLKGVRDNILRRIHAALNKYSHPYDGKAREAVGCDFHYKASKMSPVGMKNVCDLTIEDVNHYITIDGVVNVNTNIYFDELGNYPTDFPYLFMFSNLRSAAGVKCYMRATGNPGGIGAAWVKARFVTNRKPMQVYRVGDRTREFIPAKLEDNPLLMATDYDKMLKTLPPHLYKAFRHGDWDVFAGQVFSEWDQSRHVIDPFPLDPSWYRFASMDWGYAKPYSIGFWAVTNEGRMIRFAEMYGATKPNEGTREQASVVAKKAGEMAAFVGIEDMVADPAIWARQGFSEESVANIFSEYFVMLKGINDRLAGAYALHDYLKTDLHDGGPMLVSFPNCKDFIRTTPMLTADKKKPEDIDTRAEDHCFDLDEMIETKNGLQKFRDIIGSEGEVKTIKGFMPYNNCRITRSTECLELLFNDGKKITCTPDHKFMLWDGSWCIAEDLIGKICYNKEYLVQSSSQKNAKQSIEENQESMILQEYVSPVGKHSKSINIKRPRHAPESALGLKVVSLKKVKSRQVACINVPTIHSFILSDLVVANCYDETRYAIMHVKSESSNVTDYQRYHEQETSLLRRKLSNG